MAKFYLGTHLPAWLSYCPFSLFVSVKRMMSRRKPIITKRSYGLDSGAFSELALNGKWVMSAKAYVEEVRNISLLVPGMDFAVIQDWMCEPFMLNITGLTVWEHQVRTVSSYLELKALAPEITWLPVIQGYTEGEYVKCVEMYEKNGVVLTELPKVGVGSVCKRQATQEIVNITKRLLPINQHLFGVKKLGVVNLFPNMTSFDSMAWSYDARTKPRLPICVHGENCANCINFALQWRQDLVDILNKGRREGRC